MSFVPDDVRAATASALQQWADQAGVVVVHAAVAPRSALPEEGAALPEEYTARVAYVKRQAYHGNRIAQTEVLPGISVRTMAMEVEEAYDQARRDPLWYGIGITSPYMDYFVSDSVVDSPAMRALAPQSAEVGPAVRAAMIQALNRHVDYAGAFASGQFATQASAPPPAVADTPFGAFDAPAETAMTAQARSAMARGFAALAANAHLSRGGLPQAEALDFPPELRERIGYSLSEAMAEIERGQSPDFAAARSIAQEDISAQLQQRNDAAATYSMEIGTAYVGVLNAVNAMRQEAFAPPAPPELPSPSFA